ncbi:hypothetical protein MMF93_17255 [Streptomyces tubbatahanensis]|uniref:Uncharacterized protein n=1 Tax=Streptomyces tubbatahanensis TaxID=2923272 RepID=A0ABY3XU72_9ACTN|nr:hypothetical protein [Streptomyces tubbatahanensis]UNS98022.1 hypothetical protein MMF93_17255 [Streptomyces tubbatahanensis]
MNNPHTAPIPPIPPAPRPPGTPDDRPLRKRALVWVVGSALFLGGVAIGSAGGDGQQTAAHAAKPAATITATTTAKPEPRPTVTKTVEAEAEPAPTVTVTKTVTAPAADPGNGSGGGSSSQDSADSNCTLTSNSGNCYAAGQFCRNRDHGATTSTASGRSIKCAYRSNAWRWTYS